MNMCVRVRGGFEGEGGKERFGERGKESGWRVEWERVFTFMMRESVRDGVCVRERHTYM